MQTSRLKCDRCASVSAVFTEDDPDPMKDWEVIEMGEFETYRAFDLCPHCMISLMQWIDSVKPKEGGNVVKF